MTESDDLGMVEAWGCDHWPRTDDVSLVTDKSGGSFSE